jgi:membrane-associated phospholipid phosphatase
VRVQRGVSALAAVVLLPASAPAGERREQGLLAAADRLWFDELPLEPRFRVEHAPRPLGSWWTTAALGVGLASVRYGWDGPEEPRWEGGVLFDDPLRQALRAGSRSDRERADAWSDALQVLVWGQLFVDTSLVRDRHVQLDLWRINLDSTFASLWAAELTKTGLARERPDGSNARSFLSGHATNAATGAGLVCAHHLHGHLYGNAIADRMACATAVTAALASGILRVVADKHYATDVLAGWGTGFLLGYLLPSRWYYHPEAEGRRARALLLPEPIRGGFGLRYVRRF